MLALRLPPQSGLGDRVGTWVNILALGLMRNESVYLNWRLPMKKMPLNVRADSMEGLRCIQFPSYAVNSSVFRASSLPTTWIPGYRYLVYGQGGVQHERSGREDKHTQGLELVPHVVYGAWKGLRFLREQSLDDYMRAYRSVVCQVQLRPSCSHPVGKELAAHNRDRLVLFLHLRRTDRGGDTDDRLKLWGLEKRASFENQTHATVRRLARFFDQQSAPILWVVLSDSAKDAAAALASIQSSLTPGSPQRASIAPANCSLQLFFAMGAASGIVQSVIRTGAARRGSG